MNSGGRRSGAAELSVELFATIRALLDAGKARSSVLLAHGLDDARWREEGERVLSELGDAAEQADLQKLRCYEDAYRATWRQVAHDDPMPAPRLAHAEAEAEAMLRAVESRDTETVDGAVALSARLPFAQGNPPVSLGSGGEASAAGRALPDDGHETLPLAPGAQLHLREPLPFAPAVAEAPAVVEESAVARTSVGAPLAATQDLDVSLLRQALLPVVEGRSAPAPAPDGVAQEGSAAASDEDDETFILRQAEGAPVRIDLPFAPEGVPRMSLEEYAVFRATLASKGEENVEAWQRFGVGSKAAKDALQAAFARLFREDPRAQERFVELLRVIARDGGGSLER